MRCNSFRHINRQIHLENQLYTRYLRRVHRSTLIQSYDENENDTVFTTIDITPLLTQTKSYDYVRHWSRNV
jgi:hypothetical protein